MRRTLVVAGGLALVAVPAVLNIVWPEASDVSVNRRVALNGPIQSFSQSDNMIQIRLAAPEGPRSDGAVRNLIVSSADGSVLTIPLRPGQTWASSPLPPALANAGAIDISIR